MSKRKNSKPEVLEDEFRKYEPKNDSAYKHEFIDMGDTSVAVKIPIFVSMSRLRILDKICDTIDMPLATYLKQALYEKIDSDLHCPEIIGQAFCDSWLKLWNTNNDTNDYRVLQSSTIK